MGAMGKALISCENCDLFDKFGEIHVIFLVSDLLVERIKITKLIHAKRRKPIPLHKEITIE